MIAFCIRASFRSVLRTMMPQTGLPRSSSFTAPRGLRSSFTARRASMKAVLSSIFSPVLMSGLDKHPSHIGFRRIEAGLDAVVGDIGIDELAVLIRKKGGRKRTEQASYVPGRPWQLCYCADPWDVVIEIVSHSYAEMFAN